MRVVIVGGERAGSSLAERLVKTGHEVSIIEVDEERAYKLTSELDALVVHGNGTNIDVLKDAGVENADALVALTPNDESNLMVCKLAKDLNVPRVVTRVNKSEHAKMFDDVGADVAISSITAAVGLFEKATTGPELYGLLSLGGDKADVVEVTVGEDSEAEGKTVEELNLSELCTIATITRKGGLIPARGGTVLKKNDRVILAGKSEEVSSATRLFRKQ
ncbi:hypothetical protein AKJ37_06050 [candidate division MSBL1 archaeon SCGC-AAA259I09]|uniref:Potassium transporter TrkA n=2 Tax=candidate division MSBL1 TaxID=215777 RepID=A0A133UPE0_9EURY|nr:hypothetical protein AKJ37_06050 [candidate division MSBL1 archaeon SCGC-AAA259I09]